LFDLKASPIIGEALLLIIRQVPQLNLT